MALATGNSFDAHFVPAQRYLKRNIFKLDASMDHNIFLKNRRDREKKAVPAVS